MILSPITSAAERFFHELPPHHRWAAAVRELRDALTGNPGLPVHELVRFLEGIAEIDRLEVLCDLIAEHLRNAWQVGRPRLLSDYEVGLGEHLGVVAAEVGMPASLIEDEFLARHTLPGGDAPGLEEYRRRFAARPDVLALLASRCLRGDRYVKVGRLGRGALGEVFAACDRRRSRMVAIKQPRGELRDSPAVRRRLHREAATTASLDHPAIAEVYEAVRDDDETPFFVMQLRHGELLSDWIREFHCQTVARSRRTSRRLWRDLLLAFEQLGDAVVHAHERGFWHLDLKPGNVMAREYDAITVLDWGIACPDTGPADAHLEEFAGTPEYMPPELVGGGADERADVFGLGAVLYEILTGDPPHRWPAGDRPTDWPRAVLEAEFIRPRKRNPKVGSDLESVCWTALAREPADRYASVRMLMRALRPCLLREFQTTDREPRLTRLGWMSRWFLT